MYDIVQKWVVAHSGLKCIALQAAKYPELLRKSFDDMESVCSDTEDVLKAYDH